MAGIVEMGAALAYAEALARDIRRYKKIIEKAEAEGDKETLERYRKLLAEALKETGRD